MQANKTGNYVQYVNHGDKNVSNVKSTFNKWNIIQYSKQTYSSELC